MITKDNFLSSNFINLAGDLNIILYSVGASVSTALSIGSTDLRGEWANASAGSIVNIIIFKIVLNIVIPQLFIHFVNIIVLQLNVPAPRTFDKRQRR